jgi:hypothetical protein
MKKPEPETKKSGEMSTSQPMTSLEEDVVYAEDIIGELLPVYDEDNVAFETAEMYAEIGGRFGFPMFSDSQSRSQEYDQAAEEALEVALDKVP